MSTGQGFVGYNMYAYCGNNPVNAVDEIGTFYRVLGVDSSSMLFPAQRQYTNSGGAAYQTNNSASFALITEVEEVRAGTKTGQILSGSVDVLSITQEEFILFSADLVVVSLDLDMGAASLSLFDLGYAGLGAGFKNNYFYGEAIISLWNPSISISFGSHTLCLGLLVGAWGAGISFVPGEYKIEAANTIGFSASFT